MATGVTVRNINIAVKVDANSAIAQLTRLEATLKSIGNASLITSLSKEIKNIKNEAVDAKKSVSDLAAAISKLKNPTVKVRTETEKAYSPIQKLGKLIKRILVYRTIRQALMFIGNSLRDGLNMVKEYSNLVKTSGFTEMFSTYDAMALETKATLGVAFASILETVQPIALALTNALQFIAEAISQFNAALNKQDKYLKVNTAYVEKYTQSLKDAKRQIMGFDEINKISSSVELDYEELYDPTELSAGMVALGGAIELVTTAMAAEGIASFVSKLFGAEGAVKDLTGAVEDKNTALGDEKDALDLDIAKAAELAFGLVGAGGLLFGIKKLIDYLKEHPIEIGDKASEALAKIRASFVFTKLLFDIVKLEISVAVSDFFKDAKDMLVDVGVEIAKASFTVGVAVVSFWETVKTGLKKTGDEIASKSFEIKIKVADFMTELKEKLSAAADAVKGAFVGIFKNLFNKEGSAASSGIDFKEGRMDDAKGTSSSASIPSWLSGIASFVDKQWLGLLSFGDYSLSSIGEKVFGNGFVQECIKAIVEGLATGLGFFTSAFTGVPGLFANGGYPSAGSMFIAGEAGPEIVGSINGKTGVASGDEVTGIRTAVYSIGEAIVSAINNKDMDASIRLDDGSIYKASQRGAKRVGASLIQFQR